MMNSKEIGTSAAALGNQISAGIPLGQALSRMAQLQPQYTEFWARSVQEIQSGRMLSESLNEAWPEALVSAVRAGEHSGKLDTVFVRIEQTIELQLALQSSVMRLAYPVGMGLAGLGVFLGFMVFVLPNLARSLGAKGASGPIFEFSTWLSAIVIDNYMVLGIGTGAGVAVLYSWQKAPEARDWILEVCLDIPLIRDALRDMYFGLWANYMAMVTTAGVPTTSGLTLTAPVLPGALRESIQAFERDLSVNNKSISDAADLARLPPDDVRVNWWPFYIANAFLVGDRTGVIDKELLRVAPALIKDGIRTLDRVIAVANVAAIFAAALLIVSPLAAYYTEVFSAIHSAGR